MGQTYTRGDEPIPGYRLAQFLGRGAFGEVWKATGPGGTECALKVISLVDKQGFKEFRAIRLVKRIHHPNLVPILAFWLKDEQGNILDDAGDADSVWLRGKEADLFIAMGLGDKNLGDRLRDCKLEGKDGIPAQELLDYMEEAAKAIDFLNQPRHDLGSGPVSIQHCDIKPQNILIVGGSAQVCDFGLARQLNDVRKTSTAAGTYAYIAPESIENQPSNSNDQYSLAISYVELRTGSLPFDANSLYEVMFVHLQGKLDFSRVPEAERTVLKRATALKPTDRYPNCQEFIRALRKAVEGKSSPSVTLSGPMKGLLEAGMEIVPGYKLTRFIGKGGYGEVWEAKAPGGKLIALKIIRNLEARSGQQEFKALELIKAVDHNHLMELHAYWLLDTQGQIIPDEVRNTPGAPPASILVIATKLAKKNLLERLHECRKEQDGSGGIPLHELLPYIRQAASAIDYLNAAHHALGDRRVSIQHRDIKPENILLAADTVKVTDFGLAKVLEGTSAVIHGDSAGLTLSYAAPEMFANTVTSWSDQYSLALTYFHLRTGSLPFKSGTPTEIMMVHVDGRLDLGALPDAERGVIKKATAADPKRRFPSCTDMVKALADACGVTQTTLGLGHSSVAGGSGLVRRPKIPDSDPDLPGKSTRLAPSRTDRPLGKTDPQPVSTARPVASPAASTAAVKPEFNPYLTVTTAPPANVAEIADLTESPRDTDPPRSLERETDQGAIWQSVSGLPEQKDDGVMVASASVQTEARKSAPAVGWKEDSRASKPAETKKGTGGLIKVVAMLVFVGVVIGGGIAIFWPKPPRPPEFQEAVRAIEELLKQEKYSEAFERIAGKTDTLPNDKVTDLTKRLATEWRKKAEREWAASRYETMDETLKGLLACFDKDLAVLELKEKLKQRQEERDEELRRARKSIAAARWEEALVVAEKIRNQSSEWERFARDLESEALNAGRDKGFSRMREAEKAKDPLEANALFTEVHQIAEKIKNSDAALAAPLLNDLAKEWERYGQKFAYVNPEQANQVADQFGRVTNDPRAGKLKEFIRNAAGMNAAKQFGRKVGDALEQLDAAAALEALHQLNQQSVETRKPISTSLEDRFPDFVATLSDKRNSTEIGGQLVGELAKLSHPEANVALLRAVIAARDKDFTKLEEHFKDADQRKAPAAFRAAALNQVMKWYLDGKKDALALPKVLDLAEPSLGEESVQENYVKLVAHLLHERLPALAEPEDFRKIRDYCQRAQKLNRLLDPLTSCFLVECLLLEPHVKPPTKLLKSGLAGARELLRGISASANRDPAYAEFVRGLFQQAEDRWADATGHYDTAFSRVPEAQALRLAFRRTLAAEAYFKAGAEGSPGDAIRLLARANELHPAVPVAYQLKLLEVAASSPNDFQGHLAAVAERAGFENWAKADLVRVGNLFVEWAERPNSKGSELVDKVGRPLEAATEANPKDWQTNYWKGVFHWKKRHLPEERKKAYVYLGRVLAKSERELGFGDLYEKRVYDLAGPAQDRLDILNAVIPKNVQAEHTELLLKRLRLVVGDLKLLQADFNNPTPTFVSDADDVLRLRKEPQYQIQAQTGAWLGYYFGLEKAFIPRNDKYSQLQNERYKEIGELLLLDDTYQWPAALGERGWAEIYAKNADPAVAAKIRKMIEKHTPKPSGGSSRQRLESLKIYHA